MSWDLFKTIHKLGFQDLDYYGPAYAYLLRRFPGWSAYHSALGTTISNLQAAIQQRQQETVPLSPSTTLGQSQNLVEIIQAAA